MFGWFKKKAEPGKPDASMLLPRIKNAHFGEYLAAQGVPPDELPIIEPLVADLFVTYAFDVGQGFVMVMPYHLAELGLARENLRELAMTNLRARTPNVQIHAKGSVHRVVVGDNLDACTLLSPKLWTSAAQDLPGGIVAMVPNRDFLVYCDATSTEARAAMAMMAAMAFATGGTHALSVQPIRWTERGWEPDAA